MSALKNIVNVYLNLMNKRPFTMQAIQSGLLMGSGDLIAQTVIDKKKFKDIQWRRTFNFFGVGLVVVGPIISRWYVVLEKLVPSEKSFKTTLKKILIDQTCFAPCFIPVLMTSISITEKKSFEEIKLKLQNDYTDVLAANYKLWPFIQLFNFYFVPLNYRVICVQVVALGWNSYISWKMSQQLPTEPIFKMDQ